MDRGDADRQHQDQTCRRQQHVGIPGEEDAELVPGTGLRRFGVADGDEHGVCHDEGDGPRRQATVPAQETVLTQHSLYRGDAAHEEDHHEGEVGPDKSGQAAEKRGDAAGCMELSVGFCGQGNAHTDAHAEPNDDRGSIDGPRSRSRSRGGSPAGGAVISSGLRSPADRMWIPPPNLLVPLLLPHMIAAQAESRLCVTAAPAEHGGSAGLPFRPPKGGNADAGQEPFSSLSARPQRPGGWACEPWPVDASDPGQDAARILVVDDEPSIVDAVATVLRYEGFEVSEARPGRKALALVQEELSTS